MHEHLHQALVHKVVSLLWLEGVGEVGDDIQMCLLPTSRLRNWLARLVNIVGVLSKKHISLKKSCTDIFACWSIRDPKQHPKSQEKCGIYNMSPLRIVLRVSLVIVSAWHFVLWTSLLYRQRYIVVYLSSEKCTYSESFWVKTSTKCPEYKPECNRIHSAKGV